ncbi:MAG: Hsp20/alpha crystallin family protein [Acidimicrobiia bacterium]
MTSEQQRRQDVVDATAAAEASMRTQTVPVNLYETTDALVVVAPVPAVTADDVTIELTGSTLRFWAHLRSAAPRDYLVHEWDYGGYEREVELPAGFGRDVEASLGSGQLAIRVLRGDAGASTITATPHSA